MMKRHLPKNSLMLVLTAFLLLSVGCASTDSKKKDTLAGIAPGAEATSPETKATETATPEEGAAPMDEAPVSNVPDDMDSNREVELPEAVGQALNEAIGEMQRGDLGDARQSLEALTSDPDAGYLAHYNLGVLSVREGQENGAENAFREALRLNPDFTPALVSLTRLYLRQDKPGLALQSAERFVRERPDNLDHVSVKLQVMVRLGRHEEVIRDAKNVLRKDERNVQAMISTASAYKELGKYELAETILLQVVDLVEEDPFVLSDARYQLGFVYLAMDNDLKARLSFEKAVEQRPDFVEARNNLGVMYHRARDYSSAIEEFENAVQFYPGYKEAYLNLGNAQKGKKNYAQAEDAFKAAIRVDGKYAPAYFNLGILYLDGSFEGRDRKEQFQQAIDNFNRYKTERGAGLERDDPADKYIGEALKKIELEKQREQQEREAAMEPEEEFPDDEFPEEGEGGEEFPEEGDEEFPEEDGDK